MRARLTDAIAYNDRRAQQLLDKKTPDALNARKARDRAEQLQHRLAIRETELNQQRAIRPIPPAVIAGALIVPAASLAPVSDGAGPTRTVDAEARRQVELIAMGTVIETERALGNTPRDVSAENVGYDIESTDGVTGRLRFIEVKGRNAAEKDITVTANELHVGLNVPEQFILAVVLVDGGRIDGPHYVPHPFTGLANVAQSATNFNIAKLLEQAVPPSAVFRDERQQEPAPA